MNLSILVHTFNEYQFLWPGCFDAWEANMNQYCPAYFGTDTQNHDHYTQSRFKFIYSGSGEWSDRLIGILNQTPTKYVLYCQEDHWPTKTPPNLSQMMEIVSEKKLLRLQLSPINHFYKLQGGELPLFFHPESKYLVSHQPSIWNKNFLFDCLKSGETPWQNEYEGTIRLQKRVDLTEKIAIWPCNWYDHKCSRGKLIE